MDLQLQAGFTESESEFEFVIRMHFSLNLKQDSM